MAAPEQKETKGRISVPRGSCWGATNLYNRVSNGYFSSLQQMGYGRRAMNLLVQYYEGNIPSLAEEGKEDGQISTLTGDEVTNLQHIQLI